MIGKIFITRTGYDPELGKYVKDPHLGQPPTLGACRPDIRAKVSVGDQIFVISGKVRGAKQFVMCGFEVVEKMDAREAYLEFPQRRLRRLDNGEITGNIIVNSDGLKHKLDDHRTFDTRLPNYLVGKKNIAPTFPKEIAMGREQTVDALREILQKKGNSPIEIVGRWGSPLTEKQAQRLRDWLLSLKSIQ